MSYEAGDDASDTETETVSEIGDGLLSVILSGSSCNLDECASSVLTSNHESIISTIDLLPVVQYLTKQGAISEEANTVLSDESQPLGKRKEYFLTHVIKDKGIDGFNLLMGALKSCQHDPKQVALSEQLYAAMQDTFSSTETSREASPISVRDEWMSAYESATDDPNTLANGHNDTLVSAVTDDVSNEQTPLLSTASTTVTASHSSSVSYRKKKGKSGRSHKSKNRSTSSTLTSSNPVISYGTTNTYLKIILMGDVKVGKTSLVNRYIKGPHGVFNEHQTPTAGMDTCVRTFTFDKKDYILQLWDIAGGLLYQHSLLPVYCKDAVGAVFVYDVQNEYSLLNLGQWRHTLNSLVTQKDKKPIPAVVIGNKHDTGGVLDGAAVCQQLQIQQWFYVSAKTGENVESAFECLIKQIVENDLDSSKVHDHSYQFPDPPDTTDTCCSCSIL